MHDEDSNPIFNEIAKSIIYKDGTVDVYRLGRGILGSFVRIGQAHGGYSYDPVTQKPLPRPIVSNFWCIYHSRGTEMMINSDYQKLEIRKINANIYHVIIPA